MAIPTSYSLCLSFTRSGYNNRVPWLFVIYPTGSQQGIRLRVKDIDEKANGRSINRETPLPQRAFLARENAYVDNFSCWGRVVIRSNITKIEADKFQTTIESHVLSEIVGFRDCQKWVIECMTELGFDDEFIRFWNAKKAKSVWDIESGVEETPGVKLKFIRGPAYKSQKDVVGI